MHKKKYLFILLLSLPFTIVSGKDYPASLFNIYSDGVTLNTRSIQYALNYIHDNGGGRLVFHVGRYLTGSVYLRSNVSIELKEGAGLIGALNPWEYDRKGWTALLFGLDQENIAITGKGYIDGQGREVARNFVDVIHRGIYKDGFRYDRPEAEARPMIFYLKGCKDILIRGITIKNSSSWVQTYDQCTDLWLDSIYVDSKAYWNNDGIDIVDCNGVKITNSYIDASDDGICLKSHDASKVCKNVEIINNTIRSSANGIKFGTASYGGFSNVRIMNNKVYNTYRSAITFAAVDGGFVEDIIVDSLQAFNTGNAVFLRIGERVPGKKGRMEHIRISNLYAEIAATKPDAGYEYEGPVEDMPRNISPSSFAGLPDAFIRHVEMRNIEIRYPGGGDPHFAAVPLNALNKIPEKATAYPEFSMFGELPAWGFFFKHVEDVRIENMLLSVKKKDFRTAIVIDNGHDITISKLVVKEPAKKVPVFSNRSTRVVIK
ncbi:glycosyl hydrolase family 28 protein [Agriterribacter sp.]|uniref:glycoside hydrolase family 28 protein n=1 Tax=Agriterribacter sp. TaxID=2821509 RepID=UPI002C497ECD|nr:glycosyl hydrolase family 28 protein [Agriterribacter sp.]HRO47249.1 glycosyl hydrolase family 28 protein [Agriterribacter sp.]HRQ19579.1 glycosyl hydrolase family 28 protein [Agriterribacter sp.]